MPWLKGVVPLWVIAITILCVVCPAQAEVRLVRNDQPAACIVHNGNLHPAKELQEYLQRISGVELPLAANKAAAEALKLPAQIVLDVIDSVPGASQRATARQAYRLKTVANRLTLTAASELGVQYAVWGLLEDHLGCRFLHFQIQGACTMTEQVLRFCPSRRRCRWGT